MKPRIWASCIALGTWGLTLAAFAEEASAPPAGLEPSLILFQELDAQVDLTDAQRAFFEPFFRAHADQLRDMKTRLNAGELSYVGALFEGRALRRELDAQADARLDEAQLLALVAIRAALRDDFRALFFKEEHAWFLRLLGQSGVTPTPSESNASPDGGKS